MDDRPNDTRHLERSLEERFAALAPSPVPEALVARVRRRRWARRGRMAGIVGAAVLAFAGGIMLRSAIERRFAPSGTSQTLPRVASLESFIGPVPVRRASLADSTEPALRVLDRAKLMASGL